MADQFYFDTTRVRTSCIANNSNTNLLFMYFSVAYYCMVFVSSSYKYNLVDQLYKLRNDFKFWLFHD